MHDYRRKPTLAPFHRFDNRRDLHEIGARADDVDNFQHKSLESGVWGLESWVKSIALSFDS
jgi:hypothetical protein